MYIRQRCEFCVTNVNNSTGCTVNCDSLGGCEGGLWLWKCLIGKWEATVKNHCTIDHSDSHWRSTVKRMELFCTNCSYLCRFNCTSTVYMEMNCAGTVFGNRCAYLQDLVGWGFWIVFCTVIRVKSVRLKCNSNKFR